jgi:ribosomal protein S18 acetylase RimI-like enzyme
MTFTDYSVYWRRRMRIEKETLGAETLSSFDLDNFDENHRMDTEEWTAMLGTGYVAMYTARDEAGELAAVLVLKTSSIDTGRWYFYSVAVADKYRKMHLATRIFNEAISSEIAVGVINSHCHIDNEASIGLHKSLGFKAIQYVNDFYGDYEDAILWERAR